MPAVLEEGGGGDAPGSGGGGAPPADGVVSVDSTGKVLEQKEISGPNGAVATLYQSATVLIYDQNGVPKPPAAGQQVKIEMKALPASSTLPAGTSSLLSFRVVVTVNGVEKQAQILGSIFPSLSRDEGLKISVPLASPAADRRVTVLLLRRGESGQATTVDTAAPGPGGFGPTAVVRAAAVAGSTDSVVLNPDESGDYDAVLQEDVFTTSVPPLPAGAFWTEYGAPSVRCAPDGSCGPWTVTSIRLLEDIVTSTGEILGYCIFEIPGGPSLNLAATTRHDGEQFWCERVQAADGKSTEAVKVYSLSANRPMLVQALRNSQTAVGSNVWLESPVFSSQGTFHTPEGSIRPDPYAEKTWSFAGFKDIRLEMAPPKDYNWVADNVRQKLRDAGYDASLSLHTLGDVMSIGEITVGTKDARAKLVPLLTSGGDWLVKSESGNKATLDYVGGAGSLKISGQYHASDPGEFALIKEISDRVDFTLVVKFGQSRAAGLMDFADTDTLITFGDLSDIGDGCEGGTPTSATPIGKTEYFSYTTGRVSFSSDTALTWRAEGVGTQSGWDRYNEEPACDWPPEYDILPSSTEEDISVTFDPKPVIEDGVQQVVDQRDGSGNGWVFTISRVRAPQ